MVLASSSLMLPTFTNERDDTASPTKLLGVDERCIATFVVRVLLRSSRGRTNRSARCEIPAGVYTVFGGVSEARKQAQQEILTYSIVAGVGIILLLAISFHTVRNMLLVLVNLPFALVGGVVAAVLTGGTLSIGSIVGFVTLFGITTRNSIMMISHFEHLVHVEAKRGDCMQSCAVRLND